MKQESTVLWLVLFCLGFIKNEAVGNDHLDIWCLDDSQRHEEDLMKHVGNDLHNCKFEECETPCLVVEMMLLIAFITL